MRPLTLDVVARSGRLLHVTDLDAVVVRRRERDYDPGSQVVVLRGHGPLLMQVQPCTVRYRGRQGEGSVRVERGLLEVWEDKVTIALT